MSWGQLAPDIAVTISLTCVFGFAVYLSNPIYPVRLIERPRA